MFPTSSPIGRLVSSPSRPERPRYCWHGELRMVSPKNPRKIRPSSDGEPSQTGRVDYRELAFADFPIRHFELSHELLGPNQDFDTVKSRLWLVREARICSFPPHPCHDHRLPRSRPAP